MLWVSRAGSPGLIRRERVSIEQTQHTVFVSYAREDYDWVSVAAKLLNAGGVRVFMDVRETANGARWKDVLTTTLQPTERVLVFWSRHAAVSGWVQQECRIALRNGKRVFLVPVDDTPVSSVLWQSRALIGLKGLLQQASSTAPPPPPAEPSSRSRYAAFAGFSGVLLMLALLLFTGPVEPPAFVSILHGVDLSLPAILRHPAAVWVLVAAASAVLASLLWFVPRRARQKRRNAEIRKRLSRYIPAQPVVKVASAPAIDRGLGRRIVDMVFDERGYEYADSAPR